MLKTVAKNMKEKSGKKSAIIDGLDYTYDGPLTIPKGPSNVTSLLINRSLNWTVTSTAGGLVQNNFSTNDVTTISDWASLQNVWQEYRILAMQCMYIPLAATTSIPLCVAVVGSHNPTLSAPSSLAQAVSYDNVKFITSGAGANTTNGKYFKYAIRGSGVDELQFTSITLGPVAPYYIYNTSTVGTATVVYYQVIQTFTIELRGSS